jgi:Cellulase (glycosyl hydrolase family 5)
MSTHVQRAVRGTLVALLVALALAAPSARAASHPFQTSLQDAAVFDESPGNTHTVMEHMRAAGANWVRIDLSWDDVAPLGSVKPAGFDASNPGDPQYRWESVDWAVRRAVAGGLKPLVNVSEAPVWAERAHYGRKGTTDPDPAELAAFAHAAALRFSGRYAGLPRVQAWEVWNEVNASFFFMPQWKDKPGGTALSPFLYRQMVNEFASAVHGVDPATLVVAGSLYPFALDRPGLQAIPPLQFMRKLFCLSPKLKVRKNCGEPLHFDVFSHHPYTSGDPTHKTLAPDSVSIGQLPRLARVLRAAIKQGRVISSRPVQLWVTEFGWDTNPPDPQGVPLRLQARWISEAFYRMWKAGVTVASWFQMRDGFGDSARFADGLYSVCPENPTDLRCDRPKVSFDSFRFPFVAFRHGRKVSIWGVRPSGVSGKVVIERSGKGGWQAIKTMKTDRFGIFQARFSTRRKGSYRARLPDRSIYSLPFSLKRPADFPISPPVG